MERECWRSDHLMDASRLLHDAARHLDTSYPYSANDPNPQTLPAVRAMIAAALKCVEAAQPSEKPKS